MKVLYGLFLMGANLLAVRAASSNLVAEAEAALPECAVCALGLEKYT